MEDLNRPLRKSRSQRVQFGPRKELYEVLSKHREAGFRLSYDELKPILGKDPQGGGRSDILAVRWWILDDFGLWLENDVGVGYFLAETRDYRHVSGRFESQSKKRLGIALKVLTAPDISSLTEGEQRAHREDTHRVAIKYLVTKKIDADKTVLNADSVAIPSGKELSNILSRRQKAGV
jgi:hypothetical protein